MDKGNGKMKTLVALLFIFLPLANATEHNLGDNITYSILSLCSSFEIGDTLIIDSNGGRTNPALRLAVCVQKKKIKVKLQMANSASVPILLAAQEVCFINENATIGLHTPFIPRDNGIKEEIKTTELRNYLLAIANLMYFQWGYTQSQATQVAGMIALNSPYDLGVLDGEELKKLLDHRYKGLCDA